MFDQPPKSLSANSATTHSASDRAPLTADQQQLLRLNADFLRLVDGNRSQLALTSVQTTLLEECSGDGIQRMAACEFALFSLSLHRPDLWRRALARSNMQEDARHYGLPAGQDEVTGICSGFMECALFFAWHLARQRPREARFMLGMSEDCAKIVARMELWQCRQLAQTQLHLLMPRWLSHPYFWTDLLRYGSSGDVRHFKFACLLGSQLMGQDLEPSAILHLSSVK